MTDNSYNDMVQQLFVRFPSVQKVGFSDAYKPGLDHMTRFCAILGNPQDSYRTIHIAGTNGKGSVANMMASALAATGLRVGLYTSPHILDFRERMRIIDSGTDTATLVEKDYVATFITERQNDFDRLDLSFFEITTAMAFCWFKDRNVDIAVIEAGLGGRLDSTNIIQPVLSIITSIGLDHCRLLGDTREEIAEEKAGIIKSGVPCIIGSRDQETAAVFEKKAKDVRSGVLEFADELVSEECGKLLPELDLRGEYQADNLRTVLAALALLGITVSPAVSAAIAHTGKRMGFHGRWEKISSDPDIIADIGHNPPALAWNFSQLNSCLDNGTYNDIIIIYGVMADKDLAGIIPLMPSRARYITVSPLTPRAMPQEELYNRCIEGLADRGIGKDRIINGGDVASGLSLAMKMAGDSSLIYVGGSTFVVSEAMAFLKLQDNL